MITKWKITAIITRPEAIYRYIDALLQDEAYKILQQTGYYEYGNQRIEFDGSILRIYKRTNND